MKTPNARQYDVDLLAVLVVVERLKLDVPTARGLKDAAEISGASKALVGLSCRLGTWFLEAQAIDYAQKVRPGASYHEVKAAIVAIDHEEAFVEDRSRTELKEVGL